MADKAKSSIKSGQKTDSYKSLHLDAPKKEIGAINKANTPKKAPGSARV